MKYYCLLLVILCSFYSQLVQANTLKVCVEDYVYVFSGDNDLRKKNDGPLIELVEKSASQNKLRVKFIRQSWPRCLNQVVTGEVDALMALIYTPERASKMVFPPGADKPNPSMYLWQVRYPFFIKKGREFLFAANDKKLEFGIGTPYQYVTYKMLEKQNLLPTYNYDVEAGLAMVAAGRLDAYVVETSIGLNNLAKLNLQDEIEPTTESLLESYWHIAFSPHYYAAHSQEIDALWSDLAVNRQTLQQR